MDCFFCVFYWILEWRHTFPDYPVIDSTMQAEYSNISSNNTSRPKPVESFF